MIKSIETILENQTFNNQIVINHFNTGLTEIFIFLERLPPAVSDAVKHKMLSLDNLRDSLPDFGREEVSKLIN